jgi:hypothetical protein
MFSLKSINFWSKSVNFSLNIKILCPKASILVRCAVNGMKLEYLNTKKSTKVKLSGGFIFSIIIATGFTIILALNLTTNGTMQ